MDEFAIIFGKSYCTKKQHDAKHKPFYVMRVKSDKLFDYCYNITNSLSKSDKSVNLPEIPINMRHHFVRGFFDGDGHIGVANCKNRHGKHSPRLLSSFTAGKDTGDFLDRLKVLIRESIPVGDKKISGKDSKKLTFCQYDTSLLCAWMYQDANLYMERKKKIWDEYDKEKITKGVQYTSNKV
jgi:hypothetical protein